MRVFTFVYVMVSLCFFFMPEELFYLINIGPKVFKTFEEIPIPSERFWVALSAAMTAMLATTSFYSSLYPRLKGFVMIHLVSKAVSVVGFGYLFLRHKPYFAYLTGAVVDSGVIFIVVGFFLRSLASNHSPVVENAAG